MGHCPKNIPNRNAVAADPLNCLVAANGFAHASGRMAERLATDVLNQPDVALEVTLCPPLFSELVGQLDVNERLEIAVWRGCRSPYALPTIAERRPLICQEKPDKAPKKPSLPVS